MVRKRRQKIKANPKISVIIINYNRKDEVLKLIDLLNRQTYRSFEIIIIDNCSADNSADEIQKKHPQVKLIKLSKNMGFVALNLGMKKAKGDIFLMLDNDVEVELDFCQRVVEYFKNNPDVDAVAFKVVNVNSENRRTAPYRKPKSASGSETTIINGGAGAIKREVFDRIGGLNEAYFIYANEFEYGARALDAGFKLRYFPDIAVDHMEAFSGIRRSGKSSFFVGRNWIYFLYEFIPFKDLLDFMPFSSKIFVESSARAPQKIRYYLLGVIVGLLTCWRVVPKRRKLSPEVLRKVRGGILGTNGFVYPW